MTAQSRVNVQTAGRGSYEITGDVARTLGESRHETGVCHIFVRHTSASLAITENADPAVRRDLETWLSRLAPDGDPMFTHTAEGPDDMPAHARSVLTGSSLSVPFDKRRLLLGTWQGVYLFEHRTGPHRREVVITLTPA